MASTNLWDVGYRLCKAEIVYSHPDAPEVFETYVWQELDRAPDFPVLHCFLKAWSAFCSTEIESVEVAECTGITPQQLANASISVLVH